MVEQLPRRDARWIAVRAQDPVDGEPWDSEVRGAVHAQLRDLGEWLGLRIER